MIEPPQGPVPAEPPVPPRAEPAQQLPPAAGDPVPNVHLDGGMQRLCTEQRDPQTDRVLPRLPAVHKAAEEARREDSASFEA